MTTTLIHHSPLGSLEIPGVIGTPAPGEPFEAPDDIAKQLLKQKRLYTRVRPTDDAKKEESR